MAIAVVSGRLRGCHGNPEVLSHEGHLKQRQSVFKMLRWLPGDLGEQGGVGTEQDWSISLQRGHKREQLCFPWEHSLRHGSKVLM